MINYNLVIKYKNKKWSEFMERFRKPRCYISGAITGTDDYMERFADAEKYLESAGYSVVNPAKVNAHLPPDTTHEEYMHMSFAMIEMCDTVFLLKGWEKSKGANMELEHALKSRKIECFLYDCRE
jgi:hypothetical protein